MIRKTLTTHLAPFRSLVATRNVAQITLIHAVPSMKTKVPTKQHSLELSNLRKQLLDRPGLLGIKRGMITWYTEDGQQFAATVLEVDACEVMANKTKETDGYTAVMVGLGTKLKNLTPDQLRLAQQAGVSPKRSIREFRVRDESGLIPVGTELRADYFAVGQLVDVSGVSKGKGFAGVIKRHGFAGLQASHGVSKAHRSAGSTGATQDPGRVLPGKKMAGHMGAVNRTVFNNEVLHADGDAGILVVKGVVPGPNKSVIKVRDAKKLYGRSLLSMKL